jgi:tetratricopeptide (TPR) repeat protein
MRRPVMCVLAAVMSLHLFSARAVADDDREACDRAKDADIDSCSRLIQRDPKDVAALVNRGNAYFGLSRYTRAIADYSEAIKLDPKSAALFEKRGDVYIEMVDHDRAMADYSEAIKLDPKNVVVMGWTPPRRHRCAKVAH